MGSFTEEAYVREKARSLLAGLLCRLDEYVEEFPKGQSRDLIDTVKFFLAQIEAEINTCADFRVLLWFSPLIEELSEVLEWLDHAHTAQTPRAYVELLCEISRQLHGGADVLVTPTVESNYQIVDEVPWLWQLTQSLSASRQKKVTQRFPRALYHVRFPRVERENILNHALFGHEFGHPIADEFFDTYEAKVEYQQHLNEAQLEIEKDPDIAQELDDCADETERAEVVNRIQSKLTDIHKRAVVELVSDAVATHLFGPSAIFASMDLLIREPLDQAPEFDEYYPPTRYRWRLIFKILEENGYVDALRALTLSDQQAGIKVALTSTLAYIEQAISETSDRDVLHYDIYTRASYSWLEERTLPDALKYAQERVGSATYEAALLEEDVQPLLERLQAGVPPSEVGLWPDIRSVDWRSTILSGWLLSLSQTMDEKLRVLKKRELLQTTHRLTVKGVEYIFLRRDIQAYKSRRKLR